METAHIQKQYKFNWEILSLASDFWMLSMLKNAISFKFSLLQGISISKHQAIKLYNLPFTIEIGTPCINSSVKSKVLNHCLFAQRLSTSVTSMTGMAKARLTCSSLETSCTLLAWTSPRRSVLASARLMRRVRSLPSMMMLSRRSRLLLPPLIHR